MATTPGFTLTHPPVKRVALTVRFQAEPGLQGWHLGEFFENVSDRYTTRQEIAPRPNSDTFEFLEAMGRWPIPKTEFASAERSLSIQGDELEVGWNFGNEGDKNYPGFNELLRELEQVLDKLIQSTTQYDIRISPTDAECYYVNEIEQVSPIELAVGVLTGWTEAGLGSHPPKGYVGVRLHGCGDTEEHQCSSLVMVDSSHDDTPILSLRVGRPLAEAEGAPAALREAHNELIELFQTYTPDHLRAQWGEK